MNSVKNHWGGEVVHSSPQSETAAPKVGDTFQHESKEWVVVKEMTIDEVKLIINRPSVCSPPPPAKD